MTALKQIERLLMPRNIKLTLEQKEQIVRIAAQRLPDGTPAWPHGHIAALFGITRSRVTQLCTEAGQHRSQDGAKGPPRRVNRFARRTSVLPPPRAR